MKYSFMFLPVIVAALPGAGQELSVAEQFQALLHARAGSLNGTGLTLAVYIPGRGIWAGATGYANRGENILRSENGQIVRDEHGQPVREGSVRLEPDDLMHTGSCTKVVVAATLLCLVDNGLIGLNDTLQRRLPDAMIPHADRITIRQMLSHTSGIFDHAYTNEFWKRVYSLRSSRPYILCF